MYNDSLKVANKILTDRDLEEIILKINDEIEQCKNQCRLENVQNEKYEREYQNWTVKNYDGRFKVDVEFYDDTNITFDNINNFLSIFNNRLHEIKYFYLRYSCNYTRKLQGQSDEYINQYIYIDVYENKMKIDVSLNSNDKIMNQVYDLIKEKVLTAPEKYDKVVKKRASICNKVYFSFGFIPVIIMMIVLLLVPTARHIFATTYITFPLFLIVGSYLIGSILMSGKMTSLYKNIIPEKKYVGYDTTNYKSIYKDDVDKYLETSEIIIGKNIDNLKNRNEIENIDKKFSSYIKFEIVTLLVLSLIVILLK